MHFSDNIFLRIKKLKISLQTGRRENTSVSGCRISYYTINLINDKKFNTNCRHVSPLFEGVSFIKHDHDIS